MLFFIILIGLILGSFISAYTYRVPRNISVKKGRSRCPFCKTQIFWYDNIPVVSYILLKGRCRKCKKRISMRYPVIELASAVFFPIFYLQFPLIQKNIVWLIGVSYYLALAYVLFLAFILLTIFIIDWEHQIILDSNVFWPLLLSVFLLVLFGENKIYIHLLAGLGSALFLLFINLITRGRGMGLGDVKLALFLGMVAGIWGSVVYMFWAFIIGAMVGIFLMVIKKKKMKSQIAFGPFLIMGFLIYMLGSTYLSRFFLIF